MFCWAESMQAGPERAREGRSRLGLARVLGRAQRGAGLGNEMKMEAGRMRGIGSRERGAGLGRRVELLGWVG